MAFNDELYDRLCKKDTNGFWKSWRKHFHMKNLKPTCTLNGKTVKPVCEMSLHSIIKMSILQTTPAMKRYMNQVDTILESSSSSSETTPFLDLVCLVSCVKQLKRNKAAGDDGITNEHIIFCTSVGSWAARSPVCPLILAYEIPCFFPFAKTVCVSVRKNSVDVSTDRK